VAGDGLGSDGSGAGSRSDVPGGERRPEGWGDGLREDPPGGSSRPDGPGDGLREDPPGGSSRLDGPGDGLREDPPGGSSRPDGPGDGPHSDLPAVRMALAVATAELRDAGCDTPRLDAELLLAEAMRATRTSLQLHPERELGDAACERFAALLARRRAREPVAYILGRRAFRHIDLAVDARVLVPRPETELLVEVALALPHGACVADVGTGSGAIALALKYERPDLEVHAVDASTDALAVAQANAAALALDVSFAHGDLLDPLDGVALDAVLSNPPYVAEPEREQLAPDVAEYEPAEALFAGADGLDVLRRLVPAAALRAPLVALEVGAAQAGAVGVLLREAGMGEVRTHRDLAGIERVVVGRR
jgi:release factor glutamine methyltransferase